MKTDQATSAKPQAVCSTAMLGPLFEEAKKAGAEVTDCVNHYYGNDVAVFTLDALGRFAELVRDAERERIRQVFVDYGDDGALRLNEAWRA